MVFNNDHLGKTSSLSNLVSKVCDKVFDKTPVIKNELINRDKVSGVSVSASKELLEHMIKNGNELYFGIPKFPPSKSLYLSLFIKQKYIKSLMVNMYYNNQVTQIVIFIRCGVR